MFTRISLLWSLVKGDTRPMSRALRHPQSPGWLKLGAVLGVLDDIVLVPLAILFLLNRLPAHLRADIGAAPRAT